MERKHLPRAVLVAAVLAALAAAGPGCRATGANDDDPTMPDLEQGDVAGVVGRNHGHWVILTAAQLEAGEAVTLTLAGTHEHEVALDAAQVAAVAAGRTVALVSTSTNSHTHPVTFN